MIRMKVVLDANVLVSATISPRIVALHKLSEAEIVELVALIREESRMVEPIERLEISPDETDNRYIECAVSGGADYLVTGDKQHLLPIGVFREIPILSPTTFLALFDQTEQ